MNELLRTLTLDEVTTRGRAAVDGETLTAAARIVDEVLREGEPALRRWSEQLGDLEPGAPLVIDAETCRRVLAALPEEERATLERVHERVASFAAAQRDSLGALDTAVVAGRAGHDLAPVDAAGCYAPGGRYPLPSSVIMTAATARAAGVPRVIVASPRPAPATLAAAAVAGADAVLAAGGAQGIAALVAGVGGLPPCDAVVGPGNRWVTAAKQLIAGRTRIDMLAGPSELLVIADETAEAAWIAADLLAQAEHDPDAVPVLATWVDGLAGLVERELARQLEDLDTAEVARRALENGGVVPVRDAEEAAAVADAMAPEHLQLSVADPRPLLARCRHYGAAFLGHHSAEVMGDYGAGPNHTLPTGGTARFGGGLWVGTFLRQRTWLELEAGSADYATLLADTEQLARMEGLSAHARAAALRGQAAARR